MQDVVTFDHKTGKSPRFCMHVRLGNLCSTLSSISVKVECGFSKGTFQIGEEVPLLLRQTCAVCDYFNLHLILYMIINAFYVTRI